MSNSVNNWIDRHEAAKVLGCSPNYLRSKTQSCGRTGCVQTCCVFKGFPQIRRTYHLKKYLFWGPDVEAVQQAALAPPPPPPKLVEKPKLDLSMYSSMTNVPGGEIFLMRRRKQAVRAHKARQMHASN